MRYPALGVVAAAACLASTALLYSQTSADEQARRLLEDGRAYRREGKIKQALDNFRTIISGFPSTDSVDDAHLEVGRYYVEIEGDLEKGRAAFEEVVQRFPQSDGAPGAYYYLGLLTLSGGATPADLDDALAQFDRVRRLHPKSEWVPRALNASGLVHRKAGRLADAVEAHRRVSLEYPSSDAAAEAQFHIGHCLALQGDPRQAMEEFQQVRNRFPDGEWGSRALDRITALYRLHGGRKPAFNADAGYGVGLGDVLKDVRALLMSPDGTVWIGSEKTSSAVPFDAAGKMGPTVPAVDVRSLTLTPRGDLLVTSRLAVRLGPKDVRSLAIPSDKPGIPEPLERLTAAVITPAGTLLVADEKQKRIFRYARDGKYVGPFPDNKEREIHRMVLDGEGGIVALDRDTRTLSIFDESGKLTKSIALRGAGLDIRRPADVAVDPFKNLYLADEEGGVYVLNPQGQVLETLGPDLVRKPKTLTLDPTGAILVYDDRAQKVLRFR